VSDNTHLLTDDQVKQFICDGFLMLEPDVDPALHTLIDERFNWLAENEPNPGNNILPRLPELEQILNCNVVRGAMISLLGSDYLVHPHRFWHNRNPNTEPMSDDDIWEEVKKGSHQDSYTPAGQARSHRLQYLRFMYYSHDLEMVNGPTHVIPGSQYHSGLTDEDRERETPVTGQAGTIFISHFDLGHAGCPNMSDRCRNMIKFIFIRSTHPTSPNWDCSSIDWSLPNDITAPYILSECWQRQWDWLCGNTNNTRNTDRTIDDLMPLLGTAHQAERTKALYDIATIGEPAIEPLVKNIIDAGSETPDKRKHYGECIPMEDACYALIEIGEKSLDAVLPLLSSPDEWTVLNAIHVINDLGINRADIRDALEALVVSDSYPIISSSINALGSIGASESVPTICRVLDTHYDMEGERKGWWPTEWLIHFNASMALARLGEGAAPAVDDIRRHHRHTFAQAGWFLTESLMRIGTPEALRTVAEDLHNRHWDATIRSDRLF
jgi:hypothetical protein